MGTIKIQPPKFIFIVIHMEDSYEPSHYVLEAFAEEADATAFAGKAGEAHKQRIDARRRLMDKWNRELLEWPDDFSTKLRRSDAKNKNIHDPHDDGDEGVFYNVERIPWNARRIPTYSNTQKRSIIGRAAKMIEIRRRLAELV